MGKLEEVHEVWLALPAKDRRKHPLAPLVAAWQVRPRPGLANINRTDRILPARLAMVDHTDRRAGRLFTPAAHAVNRGGEQLKLPGFGLERARITPALPLALYDLGGGPSMERGHGAPLALRLWVESILAVGLTDRDRPWPTVLEIPLRDLLRKLYPSARRPRPNEYWPRLMQAVEILDSTRIPWEDPETGKGGLQRIVNVSSIPRGPGKLDDAVRIIVDLPPRLRQRPRGESAPCPLWHPVRAIVPGPVEPGLSVVRSPDGPGFQSGAGNTGCKWKTRNATQRSPTIC